MSGCDRGLLERLVDRLAREGASDLDEIQERLAKEPALLGFVPETERSDFLGHLAGCGPCREYLSAQLSTAAWLGKARFQIPLSTDEDQLRRLEARLATRAVIQCAEAARERHPELMGRIAPWWGSIFATSEERHMSEVLTTGTKAKWLLGGAVCGAVVAVLFYFFVVYPWSVTPYAAGTMGGVQKADRYRWEQMTPEGVATERPDDAQIRAQIQMILQRVDFSKAMRSPGMQKAIADGYDAAVLNSAGLQALIKNTALFVCENAGCARYPGMQSALYDAVQEGVRNGVRAHLSGAVSDALVLMSQKSVQDLVAANPALAGAVADPKMQQALAGAVQDGIIVCASSGCLVAVSEQISAAVGVAFSNEPSNVALQSTLANAAVLAMRNAPQTGGVSDQMQGALSKAVQDALFMQQLEGVVGLESGPAYAGGGMANLQPFLSGGLLDSVQGAQAYRDMARAVSDAAQQQLQAGIVVPR